MAEEIVFDIPSENDVEDIKVYFNGNSTAAETVTLSNQGWSPGDRVTYSPSTDIADGDSIALSAVDSSGNESNLSSSLTEALDPVISSWSVTDQGGGSAEGTLDLDDSEGGNFPPAEVTVDADDVDGQSPSITENGDGTWTVTWSGLSTASYDFTVRLLASSTNALVNDRTSTQNVSINVDTTPPSWGTISASGGDQQVDVTGSYPDPSANDLDVVRFYRGTTNGFTRDANSLLTTINSPTEGGSFTVTDDGSLQLAAPSNDQQHYYVAEADDTSGNTGVSNEASATPAPSGATVEASLTETFGLSSSFDVSMPSTVNAGELLLMLFLEVGENNTPTFSAPSGWTKEISQSYSTTSKVVAFLKTADGTEGGTTVTLGPYVSGDAASIVYRISGAYGVSGGVEAASVKSGFTSSFGPPDVTPSWGLAKQLVFPVIAEKGSHGVTGTPSGYGNDQNVSTPNTGEPLYSVNALVETDTVDPGNYTFSDQTSSGSITVVVRPA